MIVILDYGIGNVNSILNMLNHVGGEAVISSDLDIIEKANALILPGVGAFDNGMRKLQSSGFLPVINDKVLNRNTPILGICLGMQLLFDSSEEGNLSGLGFIPGNVTKFNFSHLDESSQLKIPHMGWNIVNTKDDNKLFSNVNEQQRFYFVHSYHVNCKDPSDKLASTKYGYEFVCAVNRKNIWGAQFHPEKSHKFGMNFFKNFIKEVSC